MDPSPRNTNLEESSASSSSSCKYFAIGKKTSATQVSKVPERYHSSPCKEDSSSSSSSVRSSSKSAKRKKIDKFPPLGTSNWNLKHLMKIGIAYTDSSMTLSKFISSLQSKPELIRLGLTELPLIYSTLCSKLAELAEDMWAFSFDMDKFVTCKASMNKMSDSSSKDAMIVDQMDKIESVMKSFTSAKQEMRTHLSDSIHIDAVDSLFSRWHISMLDFWDSFHTALSRCLSSHHGNQDLQKKINFTFLFMEFSKIFFLRPEPGDIQPEIVNIKSSVVRGSPDIRFIAKGREAYIQEAWHVGLKGQRVFIVTEAKNYQVFRSGTQAENFSENFSINTELSEEKLGQHGIELLMERDNSFFVPGVVGIICVGTKMIFTYLEVTQEHFQKIVERGEVETTEAIIFYTRPFDYLNAADRKEIYEHMFWFGFIQSSYRMKNLK